MAIVRAADAPHKERHHLIADEFVDDGVAPHERLCRCRVEPVEQRGEIRGRVRSPSGVDPRTTANKTAMSTSAPQCGTTSQHRVHRLGFLPDGLNPATPKMRPTGPPNGLLHILQRGAEGR